MTPTPHPPTVNKGYKFDPSIHAAFIEACRERRLQATFVLESFMAWFTKHADEIVDTVDFADSNRD